jgi:single-stranded-DNA-specific exonuclease
MITIPLAGGIQNSAYNSTPGEILIEGKNKLQWVITEQPDKEALNNLMEKLQIPKIVARILMNRGINTYEEAKYFFRADWENLYDPHLMKDMDLAVDRIIDALNKKERIFVYGDYDVDGITAVSMLYLFLKKLDNDVHFYIPDRLREGYGLSRSGVKQAASVEAKLLISVDCGITGIEEVALATSLGIDVIISDHHEPGKTLPNAVAILDPKRKECSYPFKELAGVGVAFKLIQAISSKLGLPEDTFKEYIDLVALGSAADIVPLIDENRLLVKKGLEKINRHNRLGIQALIESAGMTNRTIGTGQIVFILAPRINAVGRLGNAERAVRLLTTDSEQRAKNIASILEAENRTRKYIDEETYKEALELIEKEYDLNSDRAVILSKEEWHPGVIGIVASRIVEHIYRPTVMISMKEGLGKGSARSISGFDIYSALKQCEDCLLGFGGHKYAAGLTIRSDKVDKFKKKFKSVANETLQAEDLVQKLWVDSEIALTEISDKMVRILNEFAPFGPQNMRPVFLTQNLQVVGSSRLVGKNHLKFKVRQGGEVYDAIGFDLGELQYRLNPGESNLDIVYVIEENHYNGQIKMQLRVKDLR